MTIRTWNMASLRSTIGVDSRPQCVICGEGLAKECPKSFNMLRHLTTKQESLQTKPLEFFQQKLQEIRGQKSLLQKAVTVN